MESLPILSRRVAVNPVKEGIVVRRAPHLPLTSSFPNFPRHVGANGLAGKPGTGLQAILLAGY